MNGRVLTGGNDLGINGRRQPGQRAPTESVGQQMPAFSESSPLNFYFFQHLLVVSWLPLLSALLRPVCVMLNAAQSESSD
jgi:hypothetical protein